MRTRQPVAPIDDPQRAARSSAAARPGRSAWMLLAGSFAAFTVGAGLMHSYAVFLVAFIQRAGWFHREGQWRPSLAANGRSLLFSHTPH
jgi:hypothetical protein